MLAALWRQGVEAYLTFGNKKAMDIRIVHSPLSACQLDFLRFEREQQDGQFRAACMRNQIIKEK